MDVTAVLTLSASARSRAPASPMYLSAPACARARPSATMRHAPACVLQCVCVHAALVNTSSQHAAGRQGRFQRLPWAQHRRVRRPPAPRMHTAARPCVQTQRGRRPETHRARAAAARHNDHTSTGAARNKRHHTTAPHRTHNGHCGIHVPPRGRHTHTHTPTRPPSHGQHALRAPAPCRVLPAPRQHTTPCTHGCSATLLCAHTPPLQGAAPRAAGPPTHIAPTCAHTRPGRRLPAAAAPLPRTPHPLYRRPQPGLAQTYLED